MRELFKKLYTFYKTNINICDAVKIYFLKNNYNSALVRLDFKMCHAKTRKEMKPVLSLNKCTSKCLLYSNTLLNIINFKYFVISLRTQNKYISF